MQLQEFVGLSLLRGLRGRIKGLKLQQAEFYLLRQASAAVVRLLQVPQFESFYTVPRIEPNILDVFIQKVSEYSNIFKSTILISLSKAS